MRRFELTVEGHLAALSYMLKGEIIIFTHTGVPPAIGNRGLGSKLVKAGLEYARENGLKVRSLCWFVSKYIRLHPEYHDLLKK
jgi:predicted GNAT family acetyltransferase